MNIVFFSQLSEKEIRGQGQRPRPSRSKSEMNIRGQGLGPVKVIKVNVKDKMCMVKVTNNEVKEVRWSFLPKLTQQWT